MSTDQNIQTQTALDFVSIGVGCFALALIDGVEILSLLVEKGHFEEKDLNSKNYKNLPAIKSALISLCLCKVLTKKDDRYYLTYLGNQLAANIGLVTMVFDGYGELMAKSVPIALGEVTRPEKLLKGASIALSSIKFGEKEVDPIVIDTLKSLKIKGTICDLGCGSADRLLKIYKATSLPGLGLEVSPEATRIARNLTTNYPFIQIQQADAENLEGVWEEVEVLMQCFMTHDIFPDEKCIQALKNYPKNFPNMKYFIIVDIVAPEENFASHMPAYDYVHGLIDIETRKYARFISLFTTAGYKIVKEKQLDMPNTYLWVLIANP